MKFYLYFLLLLLGWGVCEAQSITFSKKLIKTTSVSAVLPSANDTVLVTYQAFNNPPKFVTTAPFEISVDGINYNDTISLTSGGSGNTPVYIRSNFSNIDQTSRAEIKVLDNNFILNNRMYVIGNSIPSNQTISMTTWNIKWFGLPAQCGCDTTVARENVTDIMLELRSDIFALQEISNESTLQKVVSDLGSNYDYVISDYCSQVQNPSTTGYSTCQKLAYVFNKNKVDRINQFGLLRSTFPAQQGSSSPYYYFASGRWPFVMTLVPKNSMDTLRLVNIHGKAFAGTSEHNRRAGGAIKMTDSLNTLFANKKVVVLGDYNDMLEGATTIGFTISPYDYMLNNGFVGITRPSLFPGQKTYASSSGNIIDNFVFSNTAHSDYLPNSTLILEEVDEAIFNFSSSTTDHYPVLSHIRINQNTSLPTAKTPNDFVLIQPNGKELFIQFNKKIVGKVEVTVMSLEGKQIFKKELMNKILLKEDFSHLPDGLYIISVKTKNITSFQKLLLR